MILRLALLQYSNVIQKWPQEVVSKNCIVLHFTI